MNRLTKLFRLLEITRAQPQYGFALAEIPKANLSDLAQHHYLVTAFAWQLGRLVIKKGGKLHMERLLEIALMHDLGELFGGDIALPYGKANPKARELAKAFEAENLRYLGTFFEEDEEHFSQLAAEAATPTTTEGVIAKVADYVEVTHYKLYMHRLSPHDTHMAVTMLTALVKKVQDKPAAAALTHFLEEWQKDLGNGNLEEIFEENKR